MINQEELKRLLQYNPASGFFTRRLSNNNRINTSGIKGVVWHKRHEKWMARIKVNGKLKYLGYYTDFDDAVCARLSAEQCLDWAGCDSSSPAYKHVQRMLCDKFAPNCAAQIKLQP